jgi:hypothetical protein
VDERRFVPPTPAKEFYQTVVSVHTVTSHGRFPPESRTDSELTTTRTRSSATPDQPAGERTPAEGPATPGHGGATPRRDPADRGHVPPRDPDCYATTNHFRERLRQPGRYVSLPVVRETILEGQLRWNSTDGWRFALVHEGVRFVVVVGDETSSPVVVTGWTEVADWTAATESDRWPRADVEAIQLRTDLSDNRDRQIPALIRPREVPRPVTVGDHRVTSESGAGFVECVDCECRFRSKASLCSRQCR